MMARIYYHPAMQKVQRSFYFLEQYTHCSLLCAYDVSKRASPHEPCWYSNRASGSGYYETYIKYVSMVSSTAERCFWK